MSQEFHLSRRVRLFIVTFACAAVALAAAARGQTTITVNAATEAALEAAIRSANALAFQTSPSQRVVIEFASPLIGQTIVLTRALPPLVADHATVRVAGASPQARVVVDGSIPGASFRLVGRDAIVQNVRFQNTISPGTQDDVFSATGADDLILSNCDFDQATGNALWLVGTLRATVQDCNFRRSSGALVATGGTADVTVLRCTFQDNQMAVMLAGGQRVQVRDSIFDQNQTAMVLQPLCLDVEFGPGNVVSNTNQMAIVGTGTLRLSVHDSQFTDNRQTAIHLSDLCVDTTIADCTLARNGLAGGECQLTIEHCNGVQVRRLQCNNGGAGIWINNSSNVRIGQGSSVLDNGSLGVLVSDSTDVLLGSWPGAAGGIAIRGPGSLQVSGGSRLRVNGTATAPSTVTAGTAQASFAVTVVGCSSGSFGPNVVVDGRQTAGTALQLANSGGWLLEGVALRGHRNFGLIAAGSSALLMRGCTVDGGTGAQAATNEGILLNPGCHGAQLFGNLVTGQQGSAFVVVDCNDVLLGHGNHAVDNGGDCFFVSDSGPVPPVRRTTIQSSVAVGRSGASQNGFRCVNMRVNLVNLTATRCGTGVLLQRSAQATLVNCISYGNNQDRNRDASSTGTWLNCLRGNGTGSGSPGAWVDQGAITGQDPRFVATTVGDVRLQGGSPAIDSGLNFTPAGAGLPCVDADLQPRIRGGTVDRGACEFVGTAGNSLDLAGPWLRTAAQSQFDFTVQRTAAQGGQFFLLLCSGSGTGPGFTAPGGSSAPLVPDVFTGLLQSIPVWCTGALDGTGRGGVSLPMPPAIVPYLPELSFAAVLASGGPSTNPVIVRFLP